MSAATTSVLLLCALNHGMSLRQEGVQDQLDAFNKTKLDEPTLSIENKGADPLLLFELQDEEFKWVGQPSVQFSRVPVEVQDRTEEDDFMPTYGVYIKDIGMGLASGTVEEDGKTESFGWYVHAGRGKNCGIGLYTTAEKLLSCEASADGYDEVEVLTSKGAKSQSDRAFGLELELVARHNDASEEINTEEEEGKRRVSKIKSCFESAVSGTDFEEPSQKWTWIWDHTVHPIPYDQVADMSKNKVKQFGATFADGATLEATGNPFEVISPPLSGKAAAKQALHMLANLRNMGIQAPLSAGMHVHVNAVHPTVGGEPLTVRQIAQVWVAFVKYQLVIDEMMQPSRIFNKQTRSYYLGKADQLCKDPSKAYDLTCLTGSYFKQVFQSVAKLGDGNTQEDYMNFCNEALAGGINGKQPCGYTAEMSVYGYQREWALNLVSLAKHGTLEFRNHAATTDLARVWHWLQFTTGFVEHFGRGAGQDEAKAFLEGQESAEVQLQNLAKAQESATLDELFDQLTKAGLVSDRAEGYYRARLWEGTTNLETAPGCDKFEAKEYHGWGESPTE